MATRNFLGFDKTTENGKTVRFTGVPATFFTDLLPQINNIAELKVLMHLFYLAGQKRGEPKWVGYWELEQSEALLQGLKRPGDPRPPQELLREGLEMAITRGTIIRLVAAPAPSEFFNAFHGELEPVEPTKATWFLLNTVSNRTFVNDLEQGKIQLEETTLLQGLDIWEYPLPGVNNTPSDKPTTTKQIREWQANKQLKIRNRELDIFSLYEQNIGALTPILSEKLREAAANYPADWIAEAFTHAVNYNRRSWAYISRILENWAVEGKSDKDSEKGEKVVNGKGQISGSGRFREYGQEFRGYQRESASPLGRDAGGRNSGEHGRGIVGANGAGTASPYQEEPPGNHSQRPAPPHRSRRPIDHAKYTSGKFAYLAANPPTGAEGYPAPDDE